MIGRDDDNRVFASRHGNRGFNRQKRPGHYIASLELRPDSFYLRGPELFAISLGATTNSMKKPERWKIWTFGGILFVVAMLINGGYDYQTRDSRTASKTSTESPQTSPASKWVSSSPQASSHSTERVTREVAIINTSKGKMVIEFWPELAPNTVANFKRLAKEGFYDGTCFHRVIKGFMIQGGDPNTKDEGKKNQWGMGGPGYFIKAEFNNRSHVRGVISMARADDPDSASSQFFICHGNPTFLDGKYTGFGKLISGDEVLDAIAEVETEVPNRPIHRVNVYSIQITQTSTGN
jgi:peptidyl-prolyl cis-trans isomerase B (cyclophilin B)